MLKYADKENEDGIMFTADIDKAFHSVEYYLIFATLQKNSTLAVGSFSGSEMGQKVVIEKRFFYFTRKRETRQGDPLSA